MDDMIFQNEEGLDKIESEIREKSPSLEQVRTMDKARNLTATNEMKDFHPVGDRVLVTLKAWPTQSVGGIFMPESYTIIRGSMYVTEVVAVGEEVSLVAPGDVAVVSMYSGHHVTTTTGHAKIISESDILIYKKADVMKKTLSFDPKTFNPGINCILVEVIKKRTERSEGGIILEVGDDEAANKMDVATKTATVLAIGPVNEYGKKYDQVTVGSVIVFDAYVGTPMNTTEVNDSNNFLVMLAADVLGTILKK